jgi:guanylate kinase
MTKGPLIIISGPSGSGKSTLVRKLLADASLSLRLSVSATTRDLRKGEVAGKHYYFWKRDQFEAAVQRGEFLEWAEVFGNLYGTPLKEVDSGRDKGTGVILEIDVQGAGQVRCRCPDAVSIFIRTSSLAEYQNRLEQRGSESAEEIQTRLEGARRELERAGEFLYQVVNDDLETALAQLRAIVLLEKSVAEQRGVLQQQLEKAFHAQ